MPFKYFEILKRRYKYQVKTKLESHPLPLANGFGVIVHAFFTISRFTISVNPGYCWDGATGAFDSDDLLLPSLVHDVMYQCIRENLLSLPAKSLRDFRKYADLCFYDLCVQQGIMKPRAIFFYIVLRLVGWVATKKQPTTKIIKIKN